METLWAFLISVVALLLGGGWLAQRADARERSHMTTAELARDDEEIAEEMRTW